MTDIDTLPKKYVVWVRFNGQTSPQIWFYRPGKKIEESMATIVAQWEVAAEDYALDVDTLAKKYPYNPG